MFNLKSTLAAASLCLSSGAYASVAALTSITGGGLATSGSDQLYGWTFTVNSAVNVTALGAYDDDLDGMATRHDIGIYRMSDESLVTSNFLGAGLSGFLDGDFRYDSLGAPVALSTGDYVIVMTMPELNDDLQWISVSSFTTSPEISWIDSAFDGGSVLAYPTVFGAFAPGMFGPNFLFDAAAAPEPGSLALLAMGLAGLGWFGRRRA